MLLIRPLLRANEERTHKVHIVVFFIFVVSNCGGLLTPLGDPPLFLGFLKGVPFQWTFGLWKEWLVGQRRAAGDLQHLGPDRAEPRRGRRPRDAAPRR